MSWFSKWIRLECPNSDGVFRKDAIEAVICAKNVTEIYLKSGAIVVVRGESLNEAQGAFERIKAEL